MANIKFKKLPFLYGHYEQAQIEKGLFKYQFSISNNGILYEGRLPVCLTIFENKSDDFDYQESVSKWFASLAEAKQFAFKAAELSNPLKAVA